MPVYSYTIFTIIYCSFIISCVIYYNYIRGKTDLLYRFVWHHIALDFIVHLKMYYALEWPI